MVARKGYKLTEVGEIPEDWEVKLLRELGDALIGLTYSPNDVCEYGTLVLRASNIQNNSLSFEDNVYVKKNIPERIKARNGDLLICVRNGSRSLIGKSALLDERVDGMTFGAFMTVFRSSIGSMLSYLFQSEIIKRQISEYLGATINQITNASLKSFCIPLSPHSSEQIAIATALSDADALIEALEQSIAKKRQIKQGAMQELLMGKRRLPGFTGEWTTEVLSDFVDTDTESLTSKTSKTYTFNYISLEDVKCGELMQYSEYQFYKSPLRARRKISYGDLLISTVRPNLKSHLLFLVSDGEWVSSTGFCVVRCKKNKIDNKYLFQHFFAYSIAMQIENVMTGSNYPAINSAAVRSLEIPIPPTFEEQTAIAAVLSDMDDEITALEAKLAKARQIKIGMMQELLTGRIRLV